MIKVRVVVETELTCDTCGHSDDYFADTQGEALAMGRQAGWKIGKYHTCPKCSQKSVAPWASAKTRVENPNIEIIALPPIRI